MAKNSALKYTFEIFPYEWGDFVKRIIEENKNVIGLIKGAKDESGIYDIIFLKKQKTAIAKFYEDEMEIVTDISKANFHKFIRGMKVDIWKDINESHTARLSDFKYLILAENHAGILLPYEVVKGSENALKCVTEYNERFGVKFQTVMMDSYLAEYSNKFDDHSMNIKHMVNEANEKFTIFTESKIDSEESLKKYVNDRLKQKFGDKFDQSVADKVFNGLKEKYKDNFGAAVGALK